MHIDQVYKDVDTDDVVKTIGHLIKAYAASMNDIWDVRSDILQKINILTEIIIMKHATICVTEDESK